MTSGPASAAASCSSPPTTPGGATSKAAHRWNCGYAAGGRGKALRTCGDPDLVVEALTALTRTHPPYRRWAHVRVAAHGTPDAADVATETRRGRVPVRVQLPPENTITP